MTFLYLVRHGDAFHPSENPYQPLNPQGKKNAAKVATFLRKAGIEVEHVFHSSKHRSIETAEIFDQELSTAHDLAYMPQLDPERAIEPLCQKMIELPDKTLLVGHLPNLGLLSQFLINGKTDSTAVTFVPASFACFKQEGTAWLLQWLIQPDLISSL